MILWFIHGWGFDGGLWSALAGRLSEYPAVVADLGYFGAEAIDPPDGPFVAITHSFGAMHALRHAPPGCRGLVALNGFDSFVAGAGRAGVPPRLLDRMIARFADEPHGVLADFRHRCDVDGAFPALHAERLGRDLLAMRDMDCAADAGRWQAPILILQGALDPILPAGMRDSVFAAAPQVERATHPAGGHMLPLTAPDWCAQRIATFVEACDER